MTDYSRAIASIESGGRYDELGPVTRTGDRAYGKYQVMGANVGPWTQAYFGQQLTPEQYVNSPEAQEAVFKGEFVNRLVPKYGPEGAARAWFAGEGGMNDMGRRDILGTSVADYSRKFTGASGVPGQAPVAPANVADAFTAMSASDGHNLPTALTPAPAARQAAPLQAFGGNSDVVDPAFEPRRPTRRPVSR